MKVGRVALMCCSLATSIMIVSCLQVEILLTCHSLAADDVRIAKVWKTSVAWLDQSWHAIIWASLKFPEFLLLETTWKLCQNLHKICRYFQSNILKIRKLDQALHSTRALLPDKILHLDKFSFKDKVIYGCGIVRYWHGSNTEQAIPLYFLRTRSLLLLKKSCPEKCP